MKAKHEVSQLLRQAQALGYEVRGVDGRDHIRLHHPVTGARVSVAATPGEWRSARNTLARLERLAGRRLPREKAGKYRHRPVRNGETEDEAAITAEVNHLVAESDSLRAEFLKLISSTNRTAACRARAVLADFEDIRQQLATYHRDIAPIA